MSKHTQGDWLVAGGTTVYCLNAHGYNRFTAQVQRGHTDSKWPTEPDELEANARLIAAAPELLEALKEVLPYLTDGEDAGDEATQLAPIVRAAIKKAEGEQ